MNWCPVSLHTKGRNAPGGRAGFTLIELMVVAALLVILTTMAFGGFRYLSAVTSQTMAKNNARQNLALVLDQMTKELREVTIVDTGAPHQDGDRVAYGITLPVASTSADATRGIPTGTWDYNTTILTSGSPKPGALTTGQTYTFNTSVGALSPNGNGIILEFFTMDTQGTPVKHRIRYSLTAPKTAGGVYAGLSQRFWASSLYEPCQVTYQNNTWNGSAWSTEPAVPMTDQVVTNFSVTRPAWSPSVVQIVLEAQVRSLSGTGYSTVRLISQVTVRQ